ncbi:outer membrane beta-barrel protein [Edaphobacter albus]|uniref:outer membrane beta-barrel protein n=1 Tax=Edaphobacter sp. 4G125 TaxID=2763071 RepID=UPI0016488535|nr:outer membrane beta-barrel protein [Edaphobacter sp. 4G125]QNI36216.1 outer membrane beta-barrel protein [Edaphobacter sp. 4G125]
MSIVSRPLRVASLVFCLFATVATHTARAQATSGNPALDKQLSRLDVAVNGFGSFTKSVSGTNDRGENINQKAGSTVGVLVTARYTKSPYLGAEFNYTYARFTQRFTQNGNDIYFPGGVQANASEYSFGYVVHPPHLLLSAKPFVSAGLGTTAFRPTTYGGQGLFSRARMTYYYSAGLEKELTPHFGLRAQIRQTFYKAPDFGVNLITLQKQTWTVEPGFGFVIHF